MRTHVRRWAVALSTAIIAVTSHAQQNLGPLSVIVQDEAGKPVSGATVHCVNWDGSRLRAEPLTAREQSVSDAEGRASFEGVTLGQAFVRVVSGELGGWYRVHGRNNVDVPLKIGVGHSTRVSVRDEAGKPIADVMASADGCLPFGKTDQDGGIVIRNHGIGYTPQMVLIKDGYGWETVGLPFSPEKVVVVLKPGVKVEGITLDPEGKPVSGAEVYWQNGQQKVVTNAAGEFSFLAVAVGSPSAKLVARAYGHTPPLAGENSVKLAAGPVEKVTITLQPIPKGPEARPGVTIHGKVVHSDTGKPAPGKVLLDYFESFESNRKRVTTDDQGRFTFEHLEGKGVWLYAMPLVPTLYTVGGPLHVMLADAQQGEVILRVAEGCAIHGRVITDDGQPVADVQVMISPMPAFHRTIVTDGEGKFSIPSLEGVGITYKLSVADRLRRQTTVDVGPMKKGESRGDVELRLPKQITPATLRGTVVDADGKPAPNVNLNFIFEKRDQEPSVLTATSDDRGAFSVPIARSGAVKTMASKVTQLDPKENLSSECPVLEGATFELVAGTDKEVRLVVRPESAHPLVITVVNEEDAPLKAEVRFVLGEYRNESTQWKRDGVYIVQKYPKEPYVLEVTAPKYQARVLFKDTDFKEGDENLVVKLKKGPYPFGASIWEAVTGRPATKEAVEAAPLAEVIRKSERKYFYAAGPPPLQQPIAVETPTPAPAAPVLTPAPVQPPAVAPVRDYSRVMRVVDAAGKPMQQILLEPLAMPNFDKAALLPPRAGAQQSKSADDGVYAIPDLQGCVVSAEGLARVPVSPWTDVHNEPRTVTLQEPCTLELKVSGADGQAAPDMPVWLPRAAWDGPSNEMYTLLAKTDAQGRVAFTDIAPGVHAFAVGVFKQDMQTIAVTLKPKERRTVTVKLEERKGSKNPLVLMQMWREARRPYPRYPSPKDDEWEAEIRELPKSTQKDLAKEVHGALAIFRATTSRPSDNEVECNYLLSLASVVGNQAIADELKDIFTGVRRGNMGMPLLSRSPDARIASTIVYIEGNRSVPYFEKSAGDAQLSQSTRIAALLALGQLHTDESAAAYARLRDAAYGKPGAPECRDSYTHAERMKEAAMMTLYAIPGLAEGQVVPKMSNEGGLGMSVSEDYQTGTLSLNRINLRMTRVGAEWLVTSAEMGPVE